MSIPGVVTLKDLIDGVRDHLAAWPIKGLLNAQVILSDTQVVLQSGIPAEFVGEKALLEVDDEVMLVTEIVSTTTYNVIRAYQGSSAAVHSASAEVKIHPSWSWTDRVIQYDYIQKAIRWLKPAAWVTGVSESFTWPSGTYDVQVPSSALVNFPHGNHVLKMEYLDSVSGAYLPFYGWQPQGPYLRFKKAAGADRTLHAIIAVFQPQLQLLTTALNDDAFEEAIVLYACHLALNSLKANRARFVEYSAALNDRASTVDELIRMAFDMKNQAILSREENWRPFPPGYISTYRDPH